MVVHSITSKQDEIEITPEMIEAGENCLLCDLGGAVSSHWSLPRFSKEGLFGRE
jgi:hypothetical protein